MFTFTGFIGACLADIIMNWKLLFCDFVTENGKKHRHALVVVALLFDIALNCIIGLTPFVDNFCRKWSYWQSRTNSLRTIFSTFYSIFRRRQILAVCFMAFCAACAQFRDFLRTFSASKNHGRHKQNICSCAS